MTLHLFCLGRVAPVVHDRILPSLRTIGTPARRTGALTRKRGYRSSPKRAFDTVRTSVTALRWGLDGANQREYPIRGAVWDRCTTTREFPCQVEKVRRDGARRAARPQSERGAERRALRGRQSTDPVRLRGCHEAAQSVAFVLPPPQPRPERAIGHACLTARTLDQASTWRTPAGGEVNVSSVSHGHLHPARSAMSS
jgi:hypothetical protein